MAKAATASARSGSSAYEVRPSRATTLPAVQRPARIGEVTLAHGQPAQRLGAVPGPVGEVPGSEVVEPGAARVDHDERNAPLLAARRTRR